MSQYDKQRLVDMLIAKLNEKVQRVIKAAESARLDSIEAEGRMQTRYGSAKEESGYLADGLNLRKLEINEAVTGLGLLKLVNGHVQVGNGSLMRLKESSGLIFDYFILPYGGGEDLDGPNGEITVITPSSPIARAALNRIKGESFRFRNGTRTIDYKVVELL